MFCVIYWKKGFLKMGSKLTKQISNVWVIKLGMETRGKRDFSMGDYKKIRARLERGVKPK